MKKGADKTMQGSEHVQNTQIPSPALTPVLENAALTTNEIKQDSDELDVDDKHVVEGNQQYLQTTHDLNDVLPLRDRSQSTPLKGSQNDAKKTHDGSGTSANRRLITSTAQIENPEILKLSAAQIKELTSEPQSIPIRQGSPLAQQQPDASGEHYFQTTHSGQCVKTNGEPSDEPGVSLPDTSIANGFHDSSTAHVLNEKPLNKQVDSRNLEGIHKVTAPLPSRSISMPMASKENHQTPKSLPRDMSLRDRKASQSAVKDRRDSNAVVRSSEQPAPDGLKALEDNMKASTSKADILRNPLSNTTATPAQIPLPPFSMPTHLHLELSSTRPSPLYLHRSASYDYPYEPSRVKIDRLLNFLLLPPQLERILLFGALTCLDAWLYTFTILPLRFVKAIWILLSWAITAAIQEVSSLPTFVYSGIGRIWCRYRRKSDPIGTEDSAPNRLRQVSNPDKKISRPRATSSVQKPKLRRGRSSVSLLLPSHKADIIQGFLIIASCMLLMRFDASRMYHSVRGQAAIKLYVIYNVLEVFDRLFSALGQDVIECLFSDEILERKSNGRSKIIRPFWMFLLALAYTTIHATALLYQVITLNVAVNSYSNALLTLLMSNQFVEIKGTVFKKFEKENLFQLTCADIVERFQLWLMLLIIALRNIVELGGLSMPSSANDFSGPSASGPVFSNNSTTSTPMRTFNIIPHAFTLIPSLMPAQVLMPFLLVLGSEMLVDWLKHAYITKFNAAKPALYSRFLDVLAKDYYSDAFASQNLTRRLGLPVIPLACLFIRASLQTYHMLLATTASNPVLSASTSLADATVSTSSPTLAQIDNILRSAFGHSTHASASSSSTSGPGAYIFPLSLVQGWTIDDLITLATRLTFFALLYLLLLAFKLLLGMALLHFSQGRYAGLKARQEQERASAYTEREGRRVGGWGTIELGEDRKRTIYEGDEPGFRRSVERDEQRGRPEKKESRGLDFVDRYSMVAKRIW